MIDIAVVTAAFENFTAEELEQIESLAREARIRAEQIQIEAAIAKACNGAGHRQAALAR